MLHLLNLIFWKKVQGQKHPGRWGVNRKHRQIHHIWFFSILVSDCDRVSLKMRDCVIMMLICYLHIVIIKISLSRRSRMALPWCLWWCIVWSVGQCVFRTGEPGFELCIQQRKTTCLLSLRESFACARASKLTTANMHIARPRCESQTAVGSSGLNVCWS